MTGSDGIKSMIRRMTPTRYTVKEAAALVGRSPDTLVRWRKNGRFMPSDTIKAGQLTVYLYSDKDVELMRHIARNTKAGRPSK